MTAPHPSIAGVLTDAAGVVNLDLPCRKCGYNVRGLTLAGRCPECGTAVGYSAQGELLRFCDPGWVLTLHRGVVLILIGIAVLIIGGFSAGIVGAVVPDIAQVATAAIQLIGWIFMVVGAWLLTTPDPSGLGEDRYGTARKLIRITLLIGVVNQGVELFTAAFRMPEAVAAVFVLIGVVGGIAAVVGTFAQLQYIGKLAQRIPDDKIYNRARFLKWAIGIGYGLLLLLGVAAFFLVRRGGAAPMGIIGALGCVVVIVLVFGIMYLLMLDRLRKLLKEQAQHALNTWAAGASSPLTS